MCITYISHIMIYWITIACITFICCRVTVTYITCMNAWYTAAAVHIIIIWLVLKKNSSKTMKVKQSNKRTHRKYCNWNLILKVLNFWKFTSYCSLKPLWSGHGGSSAGSYLADPTSPIPSHFASIVVTSTWFKHILFMTEHDKGLGRTKKLWLALLRVNAHKNTTYAIGWYYE